MVEFNPVLLNLIADVFKDVILIFAPGLLVYGCEIKAQFASVQKRLQQPFLRVRLVLIAGGFPESSLIESRPFHNAFVSQLFSSATPSYR